MSEKKMRLFFCSGLMVIALITGGCFQIKADVDIHEDGSVEMKRTMMGNEFLQEEIEKDRKEEQKKSPDSKWENVSEGNMKGFRTNSSYTDIRSMAKSVSMFDAHRGRNNGVQMKEGLFFDTYSFDLVFDNTNNKNDVNKLPREQQEMARAMLSNAKFDVTINLPYPAESNNASQVTNEGKNLYWNLLDTVLGNEATSVQVVFRIWHKERVMAGGALAVILLLAMLNFMSKQKKAGDDVVAAVRAKNNAVICGVLLLLLAGGSYYLVEQKPVFTEQDIISDIKGAEASASEPNEGSQANNQRKQNSQSKASTSTKDENVQEDVLVSPMSSTSSQNYETNLSIRPSVETALGPVDLGMPIEQLQGNLGRETKPSKLDNDGFTHYYYPDLELVVGNGRVESVFSNSNQVQTKRGLRQGDTVQEIIQTYGEPYGKTEYNGSTLYEYQFRSSNNDNCLLRFAVKNGTIDYIGSRIVR